MDQTSARLSSNVSKLETTLGNPDAMTEGHVRELQRSDRELRDFIEHAPIAMHWVGEDGTILWANEAELKFLGYNREEYVGHNITDFHVDQPVIKDILRRLTGGEPLNGYEARLRCKDGSIRYVSINSSVYSEDGRFIHTRCITLDVTGEKEAAELQERLAAIVTSSDDAIISKDLNGIIRSWNHSAARLFGYGDEEVIGKPITIIIPPDRLDEEPQILSRLQRGERVDHFETVRRRKDGALLNISLTVSPVRDSKGTVVGASKVARDITERKRQEHALTAANAALTRSNADLQQFAYSASHDLQEPLRMVSTYGELLKREFHEQLGASGDEYIGYMIDSALRMEQLLKDLRAYTLATSAEQNPTQDIDAGKSLDNALAVLEPAVKESAACITRTALPRVRFHEHQLEQVFQNLIGNAIRYRSSEPLHVHVAAEPMRKNWLFSVRDNGIGIDPQYKEQVFEIFKRLHSAAEYPGTGMGLAICQRIVERAGGTIWVDSALERGSTFFFTVPRGSSQGQGG
jgi:PAS domain S-box-containing protein